MGERGAPDEAYRKDLSAIFENGRTQAQADADLYQQVRCQRGFHARRSLGANGNKGYRFESLLLPVGLLGLSRPIREASLFGGSR
jgi:hypothetical protein